MTSNVRNQGIAHLAHRFGQAPFCKAPRAHIVIENSNRGSWPICKRCEAAATKMAAAAARIAAKQQAQQPQPTSAVLPNPFMQ